MFWCARRQTVASGDAVEECDATGAEKITAAGNLTHQYHVKVCDILMGAGGST